jgi:alpha-ketoglutarate-dependent taurine dioxygenase
MLAVPVPVRTAAAAQRLRHSLHCLQHGGGSQPAAAPAASSSAAHDDANTATAGDAPQRVPVSDRTALLAALARDGVVIVTDLPGDESTPDYWAELAAALPSLAFGDEKLIPGVPPVAAIHHEFTQFNQLRALQRIHGMEGRDLSGNVVDELFAYAEANGWPHYTTVPWTADLRQNPHTDGYVYGDHVPDHIFLLVEKQADAGGESFFVDGERVLERLKSVSDAEALLPLLTTLPFDQTECVQNGGVYQGRQSSGPLFVRRDDGRLQWKRMLGKSQLQTPEEMLAEPIPKSCWAVTDETRKLATELGATISPEEVLRRVDLAIHAESEVANRVRLGRGEAVCIDNYRTLHSREAFGGESERRLWRIWTWTTSSDGRPDGDAAPVSAPLDIHLEESQALGTIRAR